MQRENLGEPLENICNAILSLTDKFDDILFVYPLLQGKKGILLTDIISVSDSHNLMKRSYMVMTDSEGLQEEAPDKPQDL